MAMVATVIAPMMSARTPMPHVNHAYTRKKIAATPTSETPTISRSTGTLRRRRGARGSGAGLLRHDGGRRLRRGDGYRRLRRGE